jgi:hypothetical protein
MQRKVALIIHLAPRVPYSSMCMAISGFLAPLSHNVPESKAPHWGDRYCEHQKQLFLSDGNVRWIGVWLWSSGDVWVRMNGASKSETKIWSVFKWTCFCGYCGPTVIHDVTLEDNQMLVIWNCICSRNSTILVKIGLSTLNVLEGLLLTPAVRM